MEIKLNTNNSISSIIDQMASKDDVVVTLNACKEMIHETNDLMRDFVVTSCKDTYRNSEIYTQRYLLKSAPIYLKEYFGTIYNNLNWFQKLLWKMSGLMSIINALEDKEKHND